MIQVLCGDNTQAILKRLLEIEKKYDSVVRIDCKKENTDTIINFAISGGLFADKKAVILENADKITLQKEKQMEDFFKLNESSLCDIVLIKSIALKSPLFAGIKVVVESFFLPKYFFMFLDSLFPGNAKKAFEYYSNIPETVDSQLVFYSMVKRVWQMIGLSEGMQENISFLGVSGWQSDRLIQQAKKWSLDDLLHFYGLLFEVEKDLKTSGDVLSLDRRLDILVASGLN